jgi:hypothetical protein
MPYFRTILIFSILSFLFSPAIVGQTDSTAEQSSVFDPSAADYLWPTNASSYASASFGETRSSHFHAALDVKTWGRKGYDVYATRDGIVHRLGRSPWGYGNVIYLKHDDGSYSVYAHLETFIPKFNQLVDSLRLANFDFIVNEYVQKYNLRVKQGDIIGYTGASGVGPPHLHFELRTPTESPFNPLITNINIKDRVSPRFSSMALEPLGSNATVEDKKSVFIRDTWRRDGVYQFGTIDVAGEVGLSVDAFDMANDVGNVYAAYELSMFVDDHHYFTTRMDSFSYPQAKMMFLDRVYSILKSSNRGFQRLFVKDGNELPFYETNSTDGKLALTEGNHSIKVVARDFYGNQSELRGTIRVSPAKTDIRRETVLNPAQPYLLPALSYQDHRTIIDTWDWNNEWFRPIADDTLELTLRPFKPGANGVKYYIPPNANEGIELGDESYFAIIDSGWFPLFRIFPQQSGTWHHPTQPLSVSAGKRAVFDTLSVSFSSRELNHSNNQSPNTSSSDNAESKAIAEIFIGPNHAPLKSVLGLHYQLPDKIENPEHYAFYRYNERYKKLNFIPARQNGHQLSGYISDFGLYHIVADTTAPKLSTPRMYRNTRGEWRIKVTARDDLSGVDFSGATFTINNERGIVEYDPELDELIYLHPDFKPLKENRYHIIVSDRIGNSTEIEGTLSR